MTAGKPAAETYAEAMVRRNKIAQLLATLEQPCSTTDLAKAIEQITGQLTNSSSLLKDLDALRRVNRIKCVRKGHKYFWST